MNKTSTRTVLLSDLVEEASLGVNTSGLSPGDTPVIRASDLPGQVGLIGRPSEMLDVPESKSLRKATVELGDVVLVGRGAGHRVGIVDEACVGAVISANLIMLRPRKLHIRSVNPAQATQIPPTVILGPVLAAYLISPRGQLEISKLSRTASVMMSLRTKDLLQLEIPLPPMAQQHLMAELVLKVSEHHRAAMEAAELRSRLALERVFAAFNPPAAEGL